MHHLFCTACCKLLWFILLLLRGPAGNSDLTVVYTTNLHSPVSICSDNLQILSPALILEVLQFHCVQISCGGASTWFCGTLLEILVQQSWSVYIVSVGLKFSSSNSKYWASSSAVPLEFLQSTQFFTIVLLVLWSIPGKCECTLLKCLSWCVGCESCVYVLLLLTKNQHSHCWILFWNSLQHPVATPATPCCDSCNTLLQLLQHPIATLTAPYCNSYNTLS